jgi:cell division protein FtsW
VAFDRTDTSLLGRWWWTVDRLTFLAVIILIALGAILVTAASPPVAERIGLDSFYFIRRQQVFLGLGLIIIFVTSLFSPKQIRRLAALGFLGSLVLMVLVLFMGTEIKGAHRWLSLGGLSLQPSEFMKPCFAVIIAWVFAEKRHIPDFPGFRMALALYGLTVMLLILQPDLGMTITLTGIFALQFFVAGLSAFWIIVMGLAGLLGLLLAYQLLPHVTDRVDRFLYPESTKNYQVEKSLEAFAQGGFFGQGPGEGEVKHFIPDSHTDFIFAVAGEEFGLFISLAIIGLFTFVVLRSLNRIRGEQDLFVILAVTGIIAQFGLQAIINMGVALHMLPSKGMTLPFLSYGGSSMLSTALGMGMLLALNRHRYGKRSSQ